MTNTFLGPFETELKKTTSRCTICNADSPAQVVRVPNGEKDKVVMRRVCAAHGMQEFTIASDARFYWTTIGHELNRSECGCGPAGCSAGTDGKSAVLGNNAVDKTKSGIINELATCVALIEVVDSCNLTCPTCFADSPLGAKEEKLKYRSFENLVARVSMVLGKKGKIDILQLSGGEPTLHPEFFRFVEWVRSDKKEEIDYLLVNTNGVRIATDGEFAKQLGELYRKLDYVQLYLQFDGPQLEGQHQLRGADLREVRRKAIERCGEYGLPITLAMTVNRITLPHLWDTVKFGLKYEHVRGASFQPEFLTGRTTHDTGGVMDQPITMADIVLGINSQSLGKVALDDFTSLPCGDPNCAMVGWRLRHDGESYSPSAVGIDVQKLQSNFRDTVNYRLEDLRRCGCEDTALGDLMKAFEAKESNAFRLSIKPFMDARHWDYDRIDRCCTHVIRPDGKLDSFCRYYANGGAKQEYGLEAMARV